jgi:perosamine synthetase
MRGFPMLTAISRHSARVHPTMDRTIAGCRERDEFIKGPLVATFEEAFARRLGAHHAVAASYGRMAFHFVLKALQLPAGAEIVVPALTSWTVPEVARVAGARIRFADVDPSTGCLDPASFQRTITASTRVVVPTHLFGVPCDMEAILDIAGRRGIAVVEDCSHALGATYRGRPVGTLGDAAFFSFQTWKPLNCGGGGMAVVRDSAVAARVRAQVDALPWPHEKRTANRLFAGRVLRTFTRPRLFALTGMAALCLSGMAGARPDFYRWERVRRLDPLPEDHLERFANVQAALGLAGLDLLDSWTAATRSHAHGLTVALADLPGVQLPAESPERTPVFYQYCVKVPRRAAVVRACAWRGVDVETHGVDVCPRLSIFFGEQVATPGADAAAQAIQIPVYAALNEGQMRRITRVVRAALTGAARRPADTIG